MMRKALLLVFGIFAATALLAQEEPKTGWGFTPMPNVSYNTDLGVSLGAYSDFFYYGEKGHSTFPNFLHHIGVVAIYATKGSWFLHGLFDSVALIPGMRVSATATYRDVMANNFYGFNGIAAPFDPALELNAATRTAWYTNHRRFLRLSASLMGHFNAHLDWMGGLVARSVHMSDFDLQHYDSSKSLFLAYHDAGLIRDDEMAGGASLELKAGFVWDSRDIELSPTRGMYAELYLLGNADLSHGGRYHYGQLVAHWRNYLSLFTPRIIFASHLGLQHPIYGEIPYYNLNELATITYQYEECSGLGSRYSVRGYRYNRIAAAGYAWGNLELRITALSFNLINRHFDIVFNPFLDLCAITKTYRLEEQKALPALYQERTLPVMASAGLGAKLQMNTNFILSVDFGQAFDPALSDFMIGMGTTYVF